MAGSTTKGIELLNKSLIQEVCAMLTIIFNIVSKGYNITPPHSLHPVAGIRKTIKRQDIGTRQ